MNLTVLEAGHLGRLESLGGIPGRDGFGLRLEDRGFDITALTLVLSNNPARVWTTFFNAGPDDLWLYPDVAGRGWVMLPRNGYFQIDKEVPWTGAVYASTPGTTAGLYCYEASVQT